MRSLQHPLSRLVLYCALSMTSSLFVIQCTEAALPCPSPCKCRRARSVDSDGEVNEIRCTKLELTAIPDLKPLEGSTLPNYLYLDMNEIKEVSKADFPPGLKIALLDLSVNIGIKISTDAFLNLGYSLKALFLKSVDLVFDKTIDIFDGLFSLERLSLDSNNKSPYTPGFVENVEVTLFQGEVVKSLKHLSLAQCTMRTMSDDTLKGLTSLVELNLSNNWLTSVPSTIKHLTSLRVLELFHCKIKSLKDNDFSGLPNLETIDLASNSDLSSISDKAFLGCENSLLDLNLQRCQLTEIPTLALSGLTKLNVLDLSENSFTELGDSPLAGKYKLRQLKISAVNMKFDPDIFKGQEKNINELSIPGMHLKTIPLEALKSLTNLDRLFLENNMITELPKGAFDGLSVHSITLNRNPLSKIEKGAFNGLPSNLAISLSQTSLSDIDFLLGYPVGAIGSVKLRMTHLVCQCSMKESIEILNTIKHVTGDCKKGDEMMAITSSKLEPILNEACEEEKRNNSGNILLAAVNVLVVSLVFTMAF